MKKNTLCLLASLLLLGACNSQPAYQNHRLSPEKRAQDLVSQLTLEEKVSLMMDVSQPVERLGIKPYNWWNEALHGVARSGLATVFPQPIGMAASFDPDAILEIYGAVSDEARAKNTAYAAQNSFKRYEGLTFWTPTVNIYRDPRWGRGIETYGEDPYLTSIMGVNVVKGLQGEGSNSKYDKLHACAKHFAVHSGPEWNRHEFDAENILPRDLYETYLQPFEALVKEANVKEVMCAYNRFEGEPCCGSNRLLMQILRQDWKYEGIILSDCGAINDFYKKNGHKTHADAASASSAAVLSGTDLECGSSYKSLVEGVQKGLIKETDIDVAVTRLMKARFELGEMDDPKEVSWTQIPYSVVASKEHAALALDIARKSMTLLVNKENFLPLKRNGQVLALMGPNANDSVMQWGNYNGTPNHTVTILEGIKSAMGKNDKLIYEPACSWVDRTHFQSAFNNCRSANGTGFSARYWNNLKREGEPVATAQLTTPFALCTSGAIVFAPEVNLTDFSAVYESTFRPQQTGEAQLSFFTCGATEVLVNGESISNFNDKHGSRKHTVALKVKAGEKYDIEIRFNYFAGDAQLNFDLGFQNEINIEQLVASVAEADVVIFAGGISPQLEGEEMGVNLPGFRRGDRTDIQLPQVQRDLIQALADAGKKVVFVNCSGSPIAMVPEVQNCQAILQAWYPGQEGGRAVAEVLYGDYNPAGRLPMTVYTGIDQLPDFEDYNMAGRTYRYFNGTPLFPFGYGLSYTTFAYGKPSMNSTVKAGKTLQVKVPVTNTGSRDGEEVIQVYLKKANDANGPLKTLRAFRRVAIPAGQTVEVDLQLTPKQLEWWDESTNTMRVLPGEYQVMIGGSSDNGSLQTQTFTIR